MKNGFKKALTSILALSIVCSAAVPLSGTSDAFEMLPTITASAASNTYSYSGAVFEYNIPNPNDSYVTLTALKSTTTSSIVIPSTMKIDGKTYTVNAIGASFARESMVKNITMPDTIKEIGSHFAEDSPIQQLTVSKNVKSIGSQFCCDCTSLKTVVYSGTALEYLGSYAFDNTTFIKTPNKNGAVVFGDWVIKYLGNASSVTVLNLAGNKPDIKKVYKQAFDSNSTLTSLNLNGVKTIYAKAFANCTKLNSVTNAYAVADVEYDSFKGSKWFNAQKTSSSQCILLGNTLLYYGKISNGTVDLSSVNAKYIAKGALADVNKMTTLKLPSSIISLSEAAFGYDTAATGSLTNVYLYNTKITYSNYNTTFHDFFMNNMKAFLDTQFIRNMCDTKAREIFKSLNIAYVGQGKKVTYSVMQQYQIVEKLYNYVGSKYKYRYAVDGGSNDYLEEMLMEKGMVCRDYADMYMYLLELAGINAERVNSNNHAFNLVQVGNDWYYVDTCWYSRKDLYMVNRTVLEQEKSSHIVKEINIGPHVPKAMQNLTSIPTTKCTLGDVNRDGYVNIMDVQMLSNYLLGKTTLKDEKLILGDLTKDGTIDITDLATLKSVLNS